MTDKELNKEIHLFFKQFRQHFFHEDTGAPCVKSDDEPWSNNTFFGEKSKLILQALNDKQGDVPSRE